MKTARICTIKPLDGLVEYQIEDATGAILSHGHQLAIELTDATTGAQLAAAVTADATARGLLP